MGRAAFWREVMVSSPPTAPWGGLSVNYIQLGLCTVKTRAGCRSSPTIPFPPHHQLDPDRYSQFAWAQRNQKWRSCGDVIFLFPISLLAEIEGTLQLQQRLLNFNLATVCFGRLYSTLQMEGGKAGHEGKSGNANSNPPDSLKSDLKCQNSSDGRQSRERERNGWQTAFHGLSGPDTLSAGHTVSH